MQHHRRHIATAAAAAVVPRVTAVAACGLQMKRSPTTTARTNPPSLEVTFGFHILRPRMGNTLTSVLMQVRSLDTPFVKG